MSKELTVQIKNNRPRLYTANGITLQPGLNKMAAADAKTFLDHPHTAIKIERGFIQVMGNKMDAETKADTTPPRANAADTIALIKGAENREAVVPFLEDDRSTVVTAAEAKIAEFDEAAGGSE